MTDSTRISPDPLTKSGDFLEHLRARLGFSDLAALHRDLDPLTLTTFEQGVRAAGAHEATIWLLNESEDTLVPAHNTGPYADEILSRHRQPVDEGLIGMVLVNGQSLVENDAHLNSQQSKLLDQMLGLQTRSLMAAPYLLFGQRVGVFSFVQLSIAGQSPEGEFGFDPGHLEQVETTTMLVSRLVEHALISRAAGIPLS